MGQNSEMTDSQVFLKKLGEIIRLNREKRQMKIKELAGLVDCSAEHIGRIEKGQIPNPGFPLIVQILQKCHAPLGDIVTLFDLPVETETTIDKSKLSEDDSYDFSEDHVKRLFPFLGMKYRCYFYKFNGLPSKDGRQKKTEIDRGTLIVDSSFNQDDGYLKAEFNHHGDIYTCKIVNPNDNQYIFFYLTSNPLKERPILVIPLNRKVASRKKKYNVGVGVMLHFVAEKGKQKDSSEGEPCYERFLLVNLDLSDRFEPIKEEMCEKYLPQIVDRREISSIIDDNEHRKVILVRAEQKLYDLTREFREECINRNIIISDNSKEEQ